MNKKYLKIFTTVLLITIISFTKAYAAITYDSISLSPSTGTIGADSTAIQLNADSGTDDFVGYDLTISFTGSVDYLSATEADVCDTFEVIENVDSIRISCLSFLGDTYNGSTATLYFKATDDGSSTFSIINVDSSVTITSLTGGTYTLSDGTTTNPTDPGSDTLPQSGIFDDYPTITIGASLILLGAIFLLTKPNMFRKWRGTVVIYDD